MKRIYNHRLEKLKFGDGSHVGTDCTTYVSDMPTTAHRILPRLWMCGLKANNLDFLKENNIKFIISLLH